MWQTHNTKTNVVVPVVRIVVVARSRPRIMLIVVPRTTAQGPHWRLPERPETVTFRVQHNRIFSIPLRGIIWQQGMAFAVTPQAAPLCPAMQVIHPIQRSATQANKWGRRTTRKPKPLLQSKGSRPLREAARA